MESIMDFVETLVRSKPWDVDRRLAELSLTREGLLKVVGAAHAAAADATPFHPANAPGMLAYIHGIYAMRDQYVGDEWDVYYLNGVEMIRNEQLGLRIGYSNIDQACNSEHDPRARSRKGVGPERACQGNLFVDLPKYAPKPEGALATFYLMVDPDGAAELSRPVVIRDNFGSYIERNYLTDGSDFDGEALLFDEQDVAVDFDPQVARK